MIALDPLNGHPELRAYVPPDSAEDALDALATGLRAGCSPVLLAGASGIGKSLLLRVLAEREQGEFARVRRTELPQSPAALPAHLFQVLFGMVPPRRPHEAELALLDQLEAEPTGRSLLLVDHLERASAATIAQLGEIARETKHVLAIVGVGVESEGRRSLEDLLEAGFSVLLPAAKGPPESFEEELVREDFPLPFELDPLTVGAPELEPEIATEGVDLAALAARLSSLAHALRDRAQSLRAWLAPAVARFGRNAAASTLRASTTLAKSARRAAAGSGEQLSVAVAEARRRSRTIHHRVAASGSRTHSSAEGTVARGREVRSELKLSLVGLAFASGVLAALLVVAGLFATNAPRPPEAAALPAPESVAAAPAPVAAAPAPLAAAPQPAIASPAAPPVDVHVNARPWAQIWIDGVELGATPLKKALPRGAHRIEARFPNGDRIQREIEVAPDRRFVSLP